MPEHYKVIVDVEAERKLEIKRIFKEEMKTNIYLFFNEANNPPVNILTSKKYNKKN